MAKKIEDLFAEVTMKGWLVNNLFQLASNKWRCSLTNDNKQFFEFGHGDTAAEALAAAIKQADGFAATQEGLAGDLARLKSPAVDVVTEQPKVEDLLS